MHVTRIIISGLIGGIAWLVGMLLFFGPAQRILADPQLQSAKFLAVVSQIEPLPRIVGHYWIFVVGLLIIGMFYSVVFSMIASNLTGNTFIKGIKFGFIGWALMVPWFEFYLPWNVMHEPMILVLFEALLWALVLQLVGVSISLANTFLSTSVFKQP